MTAKPIKRILTIDGGGLRGIFSAAIIEQMELDAGRPAAEIFDCIGGTSAGSLVAAGLASGIPATEVKDIFLEMGEAAFDDKGESNMKTRSESLKNALQKIFGDKRPSNCKTKLIIPARNMLLDKTVFFGTLPDDRPSDGGLFSDDGLPENELLWKAVLRSTALPPNFAPCGDYLDGGVSPFANPSYGAFLAVGQWFKWNADSTDLRFHSVGTGYHRSYLSDMADCEDERLYRLMVNAFFQDISFLQHLIMKRRREEGQIKYKRYNIRFDDAGFKKLGLSPLNVDFEKLSSTSHPPMGELAGIGTEVGKIRIEARDFDA